MHDHFLRSRCSTEWKASGILPFAFTHNQCYVLLGSELTRTGPKGVREAVMWSDFGGKREAADKDSIETASREFAEETLGLFGGVSVCPAAVERSAQIMSERLRAGDRSLKSVHQLKKGSYHMYTCMVTYVDPIFFELALTQNEGPQLVDLPPAGSSVPSSEPQPPSSGGASDPEGCEKHAAFQQQQQQQHRGRRRKPDRVVGAEKKEFVWVPLDTLLECVRIPRGTYFYNSSQRMASGQKHQNGSRRSLQLHPCFASSLRIAREAGLLEVIESCRHRPLPLPPPSSSPTAASTQHASSAAALATDTAEVEDAMQGGNPEQSGPAADAADGGGEGACAAQQVRGRHKRRRSRGGDATQSLQRMEAHGVDLAAAAGAAAQQWALHHSTTCISQGTGEQPTESVGRGDSSGGADSNQDEEGPQGLLPSHLSFWLLRGGLAEKMGISISPRARALFEGS